MNCKTRFCAHSGSLSSNNLRMDVNCKDYAKATRQEREGNNLRMDVNCKDYNHLYDLMYKVTICGWM